MGAREGRVSGLYEFEGVTVDVARGDVVQAGKRLDLQPLVLRALLLLVRHPGEVLTRERLTDTLWPDTFVNDEALSKVISRLRRTVRGAPIVTVPGRGYRLDTVVRWVAPEQVRPPSDRLFGRAAQLDRIEQLLADGARLVTLVGPGGVGKTRVALEWSARIDGAVTVQAAPLRQSDQIAAAVLRALGATRVSDGDPAAEAADRLRRFRTTRLLIDNLEHLGAEGAELVARWLAECPSLRIVATSRTLLGVAGERSLPVLPLDLDDGAALLADRSGRASDDAGMMALVKALDGLPLALELAASRLRMMEPSELAGRVQAQLDLIGEVKPRVDRPAHHASLLAALEHSWSALTQAEASAMARLTAWAGPFDLRRAETVLVGVPRPLDQVQRLVDASLVRRRGDGEFELLSTLRAFVRHRGAPEELAQGEAHHGAYIAAMGLPLLVRGPAVAATDRALVDGLMDEALVAITRALARGDARVALGSVLAGYPEMLERSDLQSLSQHLEAVEGLVSPEERSHLRVRRAHVQARLGHAHIASEILRRAVDEARERGAELAVLRLELRQAIAGYNLGDSEWRLRVAERALAGLPKSDSVAQCGAHRLRTLMLFQMGAPRGDIRAQLERYTTCVDRSDDLVEERYDLHNTRSQIRNAWAEYSKAVEDGAACMRYALQIRDPYTIWLSRYNHASTLLVLGDVEGALALGQRAESEEVARYPHLQAGLRSVAAQAMQYLGRSSDAAALMHRAVTQMRDVGNPLFVPVLLVSSAECAWMSGRYSDAAQCVHEAEQGIGPEHHPHYRQLLSSRIRIALWEGRIEAAEALLDEHATYVDNPNLHALGLSLHARLAMARGATEEARRALTQARQVLSSTELLLQSWLHWELADAEATLGQRSAQRASK